MNMSDLMWYLGEVPISKRHSNDLDFETLIVYHVTKPENTESIKRNGIKASSSRQSYDRPKAVYFFADKDDISKENISILGLSSGYKVVRVRIPAKEVIKHMVWDGLFNATFTTSYSAVQYFGDIPTDWIVSYDCEI